MQHLRLLTFIFRCDALVSLDGNFQQKRCKGERDPPRQHPQSVFLDEHYEQSVEANVDALRNRQPRHTPRQPDNGEAPDTRTQAGLVSDRVAGMSLADEILDECESSFKAADEKREKASTSYFSDTGLMALLCRHDRVLWLVNMTSAGEKQHYAIALLMQLFKHLPQTFCVGVLYDIACQLERSSRKWGLLGSYIDRIRFAVSIFHAYGHQWACQILYHPRKREHFGLTDGEGCERFWSSIKHLIPTLRVSGVSVFAHKAVAVLISYFLLVSQPHLFH